MTQLENIIVSMVTMFEGYAGVDADKMKLNNSELSTLLKEQLKNPDFQSKVDPNDVKEAMEIMDKNGDGQVCFKEFSHCVCRLAQGYYYKKYGKEKGKGKCK